jgi:hypothetical protein
MARVRGMFSPPLLIVIFGDGALQEEVILRAAYPTLWGPKLAVLSDDTGSLSCMNACDARDDRALLAVRSGIDRRRGETVGD